MMRWMFVSLVSVLLPLSAVAGEAARFQIEKTENGFVRIDTRTGAIALCQEKDGALACRMAADERAAYEEELGRLEKRVTAIEQALKAQTGAKANAKDLPDDAELDRAFTIMEKMMRRFKGLVEDLDKEKPQREALPQKT